jgi:hypothetical protein
MNGIEEPERTHGGSTGKQREERMRNILGEAPTQAGNRWNRSIGSPWLLGLAFAAASAAQTTLLNASFAVSRQLIHQILVAFADPIEGGAITNKASSRAHQTAGSA